MYSKLLLLQCFRTDASLSIEIMFYDLKLEHLACDRPSPRHNYLNFLFYSCLLLFTVSSVLPLIYSIFTNCIFSFGFIKNLKIIKNSTKFAFRDFLRFYLSLLICDNNLRFFRILNTWLL